MRKINNKLEPFILEPVTDEDISSSEILSLEKRLEVLEAAFLEQLLKELKEDV